MRLLSEAHATIDAAVSSPERRAKNCGCPSCTGPQGEINPEGLVRNTDAAEVAFRRSIELAKEQGAMGWELKLPFRWRDCWWNTDGLMKLSECSNRSMRRILKAVQQISRRPRAFWHL